MKSFLCAIIVLVACVTVSLGHSQYWGDRKSGDHVIYRHYFGTQAKHDQAQIQWTSFPNQRHSKHLITAIHVIDKSNESFTPILKSGGPGETFANLEYQGKKGKGFQGVVLIYGI
ncbi:uncharacterized protein [Musca autumnalis]|uniref:uncharacterized protein n=1 Tax=Musca autumnalis TaxID=221902 RepID=UPI003CF161D1